MKQQHEALGFEDVIVDGWTLHDILGQGRFATVYRASEVNSKEEYVLKIIPNIEARNNESDKLKLLREKGVINIPTVHSVIADSILVLSPVGSIISPLKGGAFTRGTHWSALVEVLKVAHENNIIHRDVKPDNIFINPNGGGIVLNDWGSSCDVNIDTPFVGSLPYCLYDMPVDGRHVPTPDLDLVALVRTVFCMMTCRYPPIDFASASIFWSDNIQEGTYWNDAVTHAMDRNYDELKKIFKKLL